MRGDADIARGIGAGSGGGARFIAPLRRPGEAIRCEVGHPRRSQMPIGRNKAIERARRLLSGPPARLTYAEYLALLRASVSLGAARSLLEAEMTVFSGAEEVVGQYP